MNGVITAFVGNYYEVSGSTVKKYYYAGSQRIAMRDCTGGTCSAPAYLFGDHGSATLTTSLGSTSLVANASGALHSQQLYTPWGESRYASASLPTKYQYTGQYSYASDFGLLFYVARMYDPWLGRFAQADTVVPGVFNPLAFDRYAYVFNSPLNYVDPSGNLSCSAPHVAPEGGSGACPIVSPSAFDATWRWSG